MTSQEKTDFDSNAEGNSESEQPVSHAENDLSSKIRFTLSASHNAKKKQVAAAFREDDSDEAESVKKRRVESLLQPMGEAEPTADSSDSVNADKAAADNINTPLHDKINQQNGWRVKLYRLNVDGSWDDCGTGRILCNFSAEHVLHTSDENASSEHSAFSNLGAWKAFQRIPHNANLTLQQQRRLATALDDAIHRELGNPTLFMHAEVLNNTQYRGQNLVDTVTLHHVPRILLRARLLLWETYQRQGESIITWCEPVQETPDSNQLDSHNMNIFHNLSRKNHTTQDETCSYIGVDLALSFQDNIGCIDIWNHISTVQQKANDLLRSKNGFLCESSDGRRIPFLKTWPHPQHLLEAPSNVQLHTTDESNIAPSLHSGSNLSRNQENTKNIQPQTQFNRGEATNVSSNNTISTDPYGKHLSTVPMAVAAAASAYGNIARVADNGQKLIHQSGNMNSLPNYALPLPSPPSFHNLEDIADILVSAQSMTQRDHLAIFIAKADCAYIHALCSLFPSAEARDDFQALATLASIIKATVLLNDPDIIEVIVSNGQLFEKCCCCLEYDPDLRDKANHRWFIRHRLKFRTVILMEDPELISNIHIAFRVTYLRDTLLRPTMDESCLSTLASLLTFYHTHVLKGVICAPSRFLHEHTDDSKENDTRFSPRSYLVSILRLLGKEIKMIRLIEWSMEDYDCIMNRDVEPQSVQTQNGGEDVRRHGAKSDSLFAPWEQHLAPQDDSLESRKIRRRGCLSFLRELFVMVRTSLQQADKDDFYGMIVLLDVSLEDVSPSETVNLLSLMGALLSDPNADISERGMCLEILSTIAMQHASLIRQHCLDVYTSSQEGKQPNDRMSHTIYVPKPQPNDRRQVLFYSHHNDLLMSLLFVMAVECDAGVMLQTSELMRIIMDTEMINDHNLLGTGILDNEEDELLCGNGSFHGPHSSGGVHSGSSEHNSFLKMFYDHYVPWLVVPFQYSIFITKRALPFDFVLYIKDKSARTNQKLEKIINQPSTDFYSVDFLRSIPCCSIRASFSIELLSFCVRAHCFRMKFYVIRTRVLSHVLKFLRPETKAGLSGERCVKLAALRFLRSILAVKDEFYNRHIVQHNLFAPVFETFRTNPIGDNLVASSIVEMCDFITKENIKSLMEYIVTKHLHPPKVRTADESRSLEDVAKPYVDTLTRLRTQYEESNNSQGCSVQCSVDDKIGKLSSEKAIEDQRKFVEHDEEESYFNDEDSAFSSSCNFKAADDDSWIVVLFNACNCSSISLC